MTNCNFSDINIDGSTGTLKLTQLVYPSVFGGGIKSDNISVYQILGNDTLLGDIDITWDTTQNSKLKVGFMFSFRYRATMTLSGNTITIFGYELTSGEALGSTKIDLVFIWDGSKWNPSIYTVKVS